MDLGIICPLIPLFLILARREVVFGIVLSSYMEFILIAGPSNQPGLLASVPQSKTQPPPSQPLPQSQPKQPQAPPTPQQTPSTPAQGLPTQAQATPQHQQQLFLKQQQPQQQQQQQPPPPSQQPAGTFYQQQQQPQTQAQQVRRSECDLCIAYPSHHCAKTLSVSTEICLGKPWEG